jgi:gluconolactonase
VSTSSPFSLVAGPFAFTEGPVWDGERVLFTDMHGSTIHAYRPADGAVTLEHRDSGNANGLALDGEGRLLACEDSGRRVVRYEPDGTRTALAAAFGDRRLNSPNDVAVTSDGAIWFTDPRYGDELADMELAHESVYELRPVRDRYSIHRRTFDTVRPNGLAFSPDERTLYVAESPRAPEGVRQLRAYPVEGDCLGAPQVLQEFGPHRGVDGMCVLGDGSIVVACGWWRSGPGGRVAVLDPKGTVLEEIPTPGDPTNVCLGGPHRTDLFLTSFDGGLWRLPGFAPPRT